MEGVPYVLDDHSLMHYIEKYRIDYVVHGDDPCIVNGKNVYESAIKLGERCYSNPYLIPISIPIPTPM